MGVCDLFNTFLDKQLVLELVKTSVVNFLRQKILKETHHLFINVHATERLEEIDTVFLFCADFSLLVGFLHGNLCSV